MLYLQFLGFIGFFPEMVKDLLLSWHVCEELIIEGKWCGEWLPFFFFLVLKYLEGAQWAGFFLNAFSDLGLKVVLIKSLLELIKVLWEVVNHSLLDFINGLWLRIVGFLSSLFLFFFSLVQPLYTSWFVPNWCFSWFMSSQWSLTVVPFD